MVLENQLKQNILLESILMIPKTAGKVEFKCNRELKFIAHESPIIQLLSSEYPNLAVIDTMFRT